MSAYAPSQGHIWKAKMWHRLPLLRRFRCRMYFRCDDCNRIYSKRLKNGDDWTWVEKTFCPSCR